MTSQNTPLQVFKGAWKELENTLLTDNDNFNTSSNAQSFFTRPDGRLSFTTNSLVGSIDSLPYTIPWDVATLGGTVNFFLITEDATPRGLFFKDDGTKMFVVGQTTKSIYEYVLPVPFDVTSIVDTPVSLSLSAVTNPVNQCAFSRDGDFLYITDGTSVYGFPLPTPWDVTSNVSNVSFTPGGGDNVDSVVFKREGDKMYLGDVAIRLITEYDLSTINDVTTATPNGNTLTTDEDPLDFTFKPTGLEFFTTAVSTMKKYHLDVAWNIQTASYFENSLAMTSTDVRGITWRPDGLKMYTAERDTNVIRELSTPNPWNMSMAVAGSTFDISLIESDVSDLWWKPDGTRLYIIGDTFPFVVIQLDASTPFDVSTLSDSGISFPLSLIVANVPAGLFFRDDGNKMYISTSGGDILEFNLTAWDITTLALLTTVNFSPRSLQAIFFKYDGMQFYTIDLSTQTVERFILSVPWDISTASVTADMFDVSAQFPSLPFGLFVRYDGEKMFVSGGTVTDAFSYDIQLEFNNSLITNLGDELVTDLGELLVHT